METLHFKCRRPTTDIEEKLKLAQIFSHCGAGEVEKFAWKHDCDRSPVGRRWVAGSSRSLIGFKTTKNEFHFSFILKFSTEESSSPVCRWWVKSIWKHTSVAMLPVARRHWKVIWKPGLSHGSQRSRPSIHVFFIRKMFIRKWNSNGKNLKKILRKSRGSISKFHVFIDQKSVLLHYSIQNVRDGIQIQV